MKRVSLLVLLCWVLLLPKVSGNGHEAPECPWLCHLSRIFGEGDEPAAVAIYRSGRAGDASVLHQALACDRRLLIPYLMGAAEGGHLALVKKVLEQGIDLEWGLEPAAAGGSVEVFNLLLEQGCTAGEQELAAAAEAGRVEIVKLLLKSELGLGYPFYLAVRAGQMEVVKLLLEHGAEPASALSDAVETGNVEMVRLLLEKGGCPHGDSMDYAFSLAALHGHPSKQPCKHQNQGFGF